MEPIKKKSLQSLAKESILKYIKENTFEQNKLPTEEMFCSMLGISRITLRSVLNDLASEGYIFRKHGKGTFVNTEALKNIAPITPLKPFSDIISDLGYRCTIKNLGFEIKPSSKKLADILKIEYGTNIVVTKKIFYANNIPVVFCEDFFSVNFLKNIEDCKKIEECETSIFQFLKKYCDKNIAWDNVRVKTTSNIKMPQLSEIFKCEGEFKDLLVFKGVNYDSENMPIVYALEYVDTDYIPLSIIRNKII